MLQSIAEDEPNRHGAGELNINIKTVKKHRQSLMSKLKIYDVAGLTRYAISAVIIEICIQIAIV